MDEQRKFYRIFQLLSRLRSPLGCTKKEVSDSFEVSERTIERHFQLLRDLGFEITKAGPRFKIESPERRALQHEQLIHFSLEEAATIKEALFACTHPGHLQKSLLDKLYALTELDELADTIYKQAISKNISHIREAIKTNTQIQLKNYHSMGSSKPKDYLLEPIRFYNYYRYLMAFDVVDQKVKQFKTERITETILTGKSWQYAGEQSKQKVDVFGMSGTQPIGVKLRLSKRARHLLEEEHPDAAPCIHTQGYNHLYAGEVYSLKGVGRFVMGLLDEIEVIEPQELKDYIKEKINKY